MGEDEGGHSIFGCGPKTEIKGWLGAWVWKSNSSPGIKNKFYLPKPSHHLVLMGKLPHGILIGAMGLWALPAPPLSSTLPPKVRFPLCQELSCAEFIDASSEASADAHYSSEGWFSRIQNLVATDAGPGFLFPRLFSQCM